MHISAILNTTTESMDIHRVTPEQFWDLYFRNQFDELERSDTIWTATIWSDAGSGIFRVARDTRSIAIGRDMLRAYAYRSDGRFSLIAATPATLDACIRGLIDKSYPYREPPPYGRDRMSEIFSQARRDFNWPENAAVADNTVLGAAEALVKDFVDDAAQLLNSLVWLLGERREYKFLDLLFSIVERSKHVSARKPIRFGIVDTAFEAMWKVNDKTEVARMIELMRRCDHSGRLKIAALFKRLLSKQQLLGLGLLGESYCSPDHWTELLRPYSGYTRAQWNAYDAEAMFWEIRYLAATRLLPGQAALRNLVDDEVSLIADVARDKLAQ